MTGHRRLCTGLVILCLCCVGCSEGRPQVHAVEGQLLVNGQPAGNASVAFHPSVSDEQHANCAVGVTGSDGSYRLTTFASEDGAPAGDYVVTLLWHDPSKPVDECECVDPAQHDLLNGRYADATATELRAQVQPGKNTITLRAVPGQPRPMKTPPRRSGSILESF